MRPNSLQSVIVAALLAVCIALPLSGCIGGGGESPTTAARPATTISAGQQQPSVGVGSYLGGLYAEALSTFQSKDPFIQQALPPNTPTTGTPGLTTTTTFGPGTTVFLTTTTSYRVSTTAHGTSTTAGPTTTTTSPHKHSLKVLSVGAVGGAAAVTLQVDNSVYKDKRIGDTLSTSWGQIKILDLNTSSRVATLLHGSETLVLTVGQQIYE